MNAVLLKIFAIGLALSQVTTKPDAINTQFDPVRDQAVVQQLLVAGCRHFKKAFDIEDLNLDELIDTAMADLEAVSSKLKPLKGLTVQELFAGYRQFCKDETLAHSPIDLGEVIAFYNTAVKDLPDAARFKGLKLPGMTLVVDRKGGQFAELGEADHRRIWLEPSELPAQMLRAFVAAEDKRFFEHHGVDERGLIRAFINNLAQTGRPEGGSTITQQVVKNLLVGNDVTYERKIREIILASRIEQTLSKQEILALYVNSIYLGRGAWGVAMAARTYFGKSVKDLTLAEQALLAGLAKGPAFFSPDRHPERTRERTAYVLARMQDDGAITAEQMRQALEHAPTLVRTGRSRRDTGFYFLDFLAHEAKNAAGVEVNAGGYTVRSTLDAELQRATEAALQEGLARYELRTGRTQFKGPETNLADAIDRLERERSAVTDAGASAPSWQEALQTAHLPLYDVHWPAAIILSTGSGKNGVPRVGLADGRVLPLSGAPLTIRKTLRLYDVIFVQLAEVARPGAARAELRIPTSVQGAALVLDKKSGRILAMAGGFSAPQSQLNRTAQSRRQPGSTLKPITYLAALKAGLQPNTLVLDEPITLPPIGENTHSRDRDYWVPNRHETGSGVVTLRRALEGSKNLATAHLLDGGIASTPEDSLERVCELAMEAKLYSECVRYYPFILGAQPVRLLDLAAFYAGIANEGVRPTPHAIDALAQNGRWSIALTPTRWRSAPPTLRTSSNSKRCFKACWNEGPRARSGSLLPTLPVRREQPKTKMTPGLSPLPMRSQSPSGWGTTTPMGAGAP